MSLSPGTRLGPYEVLSLLGVGGLAPDGAGAAADVMNSPTPTEPLSRFRARH